LGVPEPDTPQRAEQYVGHCCEPQPQLVGTHRPGRGAVGEQVELALFNAVLRVAARTAEGFKAARADSCSLS
jgi:hypothetical protein